MFRVREGALVLAELLDGATIEDVRAVDRGGVLGRPRGLARGLTRRRQVALFAARNAKREIRRSLAMIATMSRKRCRRSKPSSPSIGLSAAARSARATQRRRATAAIVSVSVLDGDAPSGPAAASRRSSSPGGAKSK